MQGFPTAALAKRRSRGYAEAQRMRSVPDSKRATRSEINQAESALWKLSHDWSLAYPLEMENPLR